MAGWAPSSPIRVTKARRAGSGRMRSVIWVRLFWSDAQAA